MGVTNAGGFRVVEPRNAFRTGRRLFFFAGMGSIADADTVGPADCTRNLLRFEPHYSMRIWKPGDLETCHLPRRSDSQDFRFAVFRAGSDLRRTSTRAAELFGTERRAGDRRGLEN